MHKPKEIVVTGGPCAGKTTGLSYVQQKLMDRGWRPFIVPEVATTDDSAYTNVVIAHGVR